MSDMIYRDDAIDLVLTYFIPRSHTGERGEHEEDFVRTIFKALPSAEAEPSLKAIKRQIDEHWYLDPPSAESKDDLISRQWLLDLYATPKDGDDVEWKVPLEVVRQNILDAPSAEAEPTVIRSKTLMPTKDFKEWAKRVRETNPNAVVIPCDAEVVSAEAVQGWIPCSERLPKRDELVLVTYKTTDRIHLCRYIDDGSENPWWSYIDDCCAWNNVVLAWMPLPKPYREDGE